MYKEVYFNQLKPTKKTEAWALNNPPDVIIEAGAQRYPS
jgi:hypothetical protein